MLENKTWIGVQKVFISLEPERLSVVLVKLNQSLCCPFQPGFR